MAYFRFVKWLFFLNVFTALLVLGSLVLPQVFLKPPTFQESLPENISLRKSLHCSTGIVVSHQYCNVYFSSSISLHALRIYWGHCNIKSWDLKQALVTAVTAITFYDKWNVTTTCKCKHRDLYTYKDSKSHHHVIKMPPVYYYLSSHYHCHFYPCRAKLFPSKTSCWVHPFDLYRQRAKRYLLWS